MQNNGYNATDERKQQILNEAWEIVYEAIASGQIKEASMRIQNIADVSEDEAIDIIEHLKAEIPKSDYTAPYGSPVDTPPSSPKQQTIRSNGLVQCMVCDKQISKKAETCPHCGHPTGVHVCPKCQSTNTKVISGASKATSVALWGPFAANKVMSKFQCKDCGHKW